MLNQILKTIASALYISAVKLRHALFNIGILRSRSFDIPIICVGNITVGGTGKTPMTELLITHYSRTKRVAILSRGYGRSSKGYHEVLPTDDYTIAGDEPLQMRLKYPNTIVAVCENRCKGVERLRADHPDIEIIIMDDGFQHRYIEPTVNVIMVDSNRLPYTDNPLPLGSLRDTMDELHRAQIIVVTKCSDKMRPLERRNIINNMVTMPYQHIFFTQIEYGEPEAVYPFLAEPFNPKQRVIALAGIANPAPFIEMVQEKYQMVEEITFQDHHKYNNKNFEKLESLLAKHKDVVIITTEKDGVKFPRNNDVPQKIRERLYYVPIKMRFVTSPESELISYIERNVREN